MYGIVIQKPLGWGCSVDSDCASNVCQAGKCRECRNHNHCSGGLFCREKDEHDRVVWNCHNKKPNNWGCSVHSQCKWML